MRVSHSRSFASALAVIALSPFAPPARAQGPVGTAFTYQGRLQDAGVPADGAYDLQLALFDAPTGGALAGPLLTREDVTVQSGIFTVPLDFGATFAGGARWLELRVRPGSSTGAFTTLGPRQPLTPSPYAVFSTAAPWTGIAGKPAGFADDVDNDALGSLSCGPNQVARWSGSAWSCVADNAHDHLGQTWSGSQQGLRVESSTADGLVGVANAPSTAGVRGIAQGTGSVFGVSGQAAGTIGNGVGVLGTADSTTGRGVFGIATAMTGATFGVRGQVQSSQGTAVLGQSLATEGSSHGVRGLSQSSTGRGVWGEANATAGPATGVLGESGSSNGSGVVARATSLGGTPNGLYAEISSPAGAAVRALALGTTGSADAVYAESFNLNGIGVRGYASAPSGSTLGVFGRVASPDGTGVLGWGVATQGASVGVYGASNSSQGTGVRGEVNAPNAIAIFGQNFADGRAGVFDGNVSVLGTLSKSAGSFKIDHPLDPENKYLSHSFVESPDMMNVYNGNTVLDADGEAEIVMPDWFEALNRDFRYQLTAIGQPGPGLHIAAKVKDNRFRIGGGPPGMEVSWQVTGVRRDPYAEKHRIPVEEDKEPADRGSYLRPDAYGLPRERSIRLDPASREPLSRAAAATE